MLAQYQPEMSTQSANNIIQRAEVGDMNNRQLSFMNNTTIRYE